MWSRVSLVNSLTDVPGPGYTRFNFRVFDDQSVPARQKDILPIDVPPGQTKDYLDTQLRAAIQQLNDIDTAAATFVPVTVGTYAVPPAPGLSKNEQTRAQFQTLLDQRNTLVLQANGLAKLANVDLTTTQAAIDNINSQIKTALVGNEALLSDMLGGLL